MFSVFSDDLKKILIGARKEMYDLKHSFIGTEHIFLSILNCNNDIHKLLNDYNITYNSFKKAIVDLIGYGNESNELFVFTPLMKKIIETSILESQDKKIDVTLNSFFLNLLDTGEGVAYRILSTLDVDVDDIYKNISRSNTKEEKAKYIYEIGTNLNDKVKESKLDPVVGRSLEMSSVIEILLRKNKCNPLLIGEAGVGKTAIVEGLAEKIVDENFPFKLIGKKIISISMATLVSGTKYRGEFEEKLLNVIKEAENDSTIILFIDEIHTLVGAGGSDGAIDASNILKPALSRGNIKIIGATTTEEYKKYIKPDKALSRRFQTVVVNEPNEDLLLDILCSLKSHYEIYHNVLIDDSILKYIVKLSKKYFPNRNNPDKSIDILDEVCSRVSSSLSDNELINYKLKQELKIISVTKNKLLKDNNFEEALKYREDERKIESKINNNLLSSNIVKKINISDVNSVISSKINIQLLDDNKASKFIKDLINSFYSLIFGQDKNIEEILNIVKNIIICDNSIEKPLSLVLYGNVGVGKDYLLSLLNKKIFKNTIRVNLEELNNEKNIKSLFNSLEENPVSLIIIDNFNSACIYAKKLVYQLLDNGFIKDSVGNKYYFNNSLVVFNMHKRKCNCIGFNNNNSGYSDNYLFSKVTKIIKFNDLSQNQIRKIIEKKISDKGLINKILSECNYETCGCSKIDELITKYSLSLG